MCASCGWRGRRFPKPRAKSFAAPAGWRSGAEAGGPAGAGRLARQPASSSIAVRLFSNGRSGGSAVFDRLRVLANQAGGRRVGSLL